MSSLAHVHQVRCSFRRLLSNHQTWSIATALLSRTYKTVSSGSVHPSASDKKDLKKRRDALIYFQSERRLDRVARQAYIQTLHDILKNRHMLGLDHREDGYVPVRELLNYPNFQMLSFPSLQKVVNNDRQNRFELLYDPLKSEGVDSWWIRVKELEVKDLKIIPVLSMKNVGKAIYSTTVQAWRSYISLKGISRGNDNHIEIYRGIPILNFLTSEEPSSDQVLIHINVEHAMRLGIRFFFASKPSPTFYTSRASFSPSSRSLEIRSPPSPIDEPSGTPYFKNKLTWIITPGNEFGFLPPECFGKVEVIRIRRNLLLIEEVKRKPKPKKVVNLDSESAEDATKDMAVDTRTESMNEHVEVTEKEMDQFYVDLPADRQSRVVHSELKKEALAILST